MAHQIGGLFRLDVKAAGMVHQSREIRRHTAPYSANENIDREFLVCEEPQQVISSERITG